MPLDNKNKLRFTDISDKHATVQCWTLEFLNKSRRTKLLFI